MKTMPFNFSFLSFRDDGVPNQMAEVSRPLRVCGCMEDIPGACVPFKMRVEILFDDPNHWHRSFATGRLRVFDQLAMHDGSLDVENLFVAVVIGPPQSFYFFRPQSGEHQNQEHGLGCVMVNSLHEVVNFLESIGVGISLIALDRMRGCDRIEVDQASADRTTERSAQEMFDVVVGALSADGVSIVFDKLVEDSVDVGSPNLLKLHFRNEVLDDVVIAFVALDCYVTEFPSGLAPDTSCNVCF